MSHKPLPPSEESSLVEFDDGPTQLGSSWFPEAVAAEHSPVRSKRPARSARDAAAASARRSSRTTPLRASDGHQPVWAPISEEASSFPAASSTLPPSIARATDDGGLRRSALSAAKGVAFGLALTGLVGLGAVAYKHTVVRASAATQPSTPSSWILTGEVEPGRQASIQARGPGKVESLEVGVGTAVHEGDVLARISGAAASTVRAPFDGVITALYTARGAEIAGGSSLPVADLADTGHVRVRLPLASVDEARVRAGDAVTVWSEAAPTRTLRATVSRVIPSLNTRGASAEIELDHPGLTPLDRVHAQLR